MIEMRDGNKVHVYELGGHKIENVTTNETEDGFEEGYTIIDGNPAYEWEYDAENEMRRTRGYGEGCFWSNWQ